ncbi:MAG TPA: argininosuccinate lyase, partial [Phycisphaerae bacterium]|nr:argininosuccinate lyase [Phycisphaerae bacterium]
DTLELIRGKSATAIAQLTGLLTLLKGLPLAYNRDLQDDKRFVFPAVEAMNQVLTVARGIVSTTKFNTGRIAERIDEGFPDATALAEYLTGRGVPFRRAHQIVAAMVVRAEKAGQTLSELPLETLQEACDKIEDDVRAVLGAENVVKRYGPEGSGGRKQLREQLAFWQRKLDLHAL